MWRSCCCSSRRIASGSRRGSGGSGALRAAALVGGGLWVLPRARGDITLAFVAVHAALLLGRAAWLGDPWTIPLHQLSSGALLIFALFMISDPRSTPDRRSTRIAFAALVALLGFTLRFAFFEPNARLYALALVSPLTPFLAHWLPGPRHAWRGPLHGETDVPTLATPGPVPAPLALARRV